MTPPPKAMGRHESFFAETVDEDAWQPAEDLAAWVQYLLHPEEHDGPRVYKCPDCDAAYESNHKMEEADDAFHRCPVSGLLPHTALDSVLRHVEPAHFFQALHAFCGMSHLQPGGIGDAGDRLTTPYLLDGHTKSDKDGIEYAAHTVPGGKQTKIKDDMLQMRDGWSAPESDIAHAFEDKFIDFAIGHENAMYVITEALAKYRFIFLQARNDVRDCMEKLTKAFDDKTHSGPTGGGFDYFSLVLGAVTSVVIAVGTGGTGAATAFGVAVNAVSNAVGQSAKKPRTVEGETWYKLVDSYFEEVDRIGSDAFHAVNNLGEELATQLDKIRTAHGAAPPALPAELTV